MTRKEGNDTILSAKKRKFLSKTGFFMLEYVRDACLLAGFFMIFHGLWRVYPPAAWTVCGAMLLWVGIPPKNTRPPDEGRRE